MKLNDNTILITGGASGIGLALAIEFQKIGNQVIVAGRSKEKLAAAKENGLKTFTVDMTNAESIKSLAENVVREYPNLNSVIHSAGIMKNENILKGGSREIEEDTMTTNVLGPMRLTSALLPHFMKQKSAMIMTVSSGLAFVPLAMTPAYCASKAAIHSYTQSLRYQLKDTTIEVLELVPPYVQTMLMGERQANDPHAMPLKDYIEEVMSILKTQPTPSEILVQRVQPLRMAAANGLEAYEEFYKTFNGRMIASRDGEM